MLWIIYPFKRSLQSINFNVNIFKSNRRSFCAFSDNFEGIFKFWEFFVDNELKVDNLVQLSLINWKYVGQGDKFVYEITSSDLSHAEKTIKIRSWTHPPQRQQAASVFVSIRFESFVKRFKVHPKLNTFKASCLQHFLICQSSLSVLLNQT